MKNLDFVICSPKLHGGGSYVLYKLCSILNERGHNAKIFTLPTHKLLNRNSYIKLWFRFFIPLFIKQTFCRLLNKIRPNLFKENETFQRYIHNPIDCPNKLTPFVTKDTIVVYPEVVSGNPLNAKKIVRWLLHKPGFHTNEVNFSEDELFFSFQKTFNDAKYNPECRILTFSHFNKKIYHQYNYDEREGYCYIIRKGSYRPDLPQIFNGPIIDSLKEEEIGHLFNNYKYCISYDLATFYSFAASLCGCISIVIPEDKEWGKQPIPQIKRGVAFGKDAIDKAIETKITCNEYECEINKLNNDSYKYFIQECNKKWK